MREPQKKQIDEQLQVSFSELRRTDGQIAPQFEATWHAALRHQEASGHAFSWRPRLALAAMLLIAIGAMILIVHNIFTPKQPTTLGVNNAPAQPTSPSIARGTPASDVSIADWQSPTAFMLDMAAEEASPSTNRPMPRDDIHFDF